MNNKIKHFLFFIGLFLFFRIDVFALTCEYNSTGYSKDDAQFEVDISSTAADGTRLGSAWDDITLLWSRDFKVKNWIKSDNNYWNGKVDYVASKDFNGKCPEYLLSRYVFGEWETFYFSDEDNLSYLEKKLTPTIGAFKSYMNINEDDDTDYTDTVSCTYEDFIIEYTSDGKAVSISRNNGSKLFDSVNDTIELSQSIQKQYSMWNGSCPTICYTKNQVSNDRKCASGGGGMSVCFDDYKLYYNSSDAGNFTCTVENCVAGTENCKVNSDGSTYNGICSFYDKKVGNIEASYSNYSSCSKTSQSCKRENLKKANQEILVLESFCNSAYTSATYADPCVKECIGKEEKIADLKDQYHISGDESNNASCGISARLANWIMKIINWMRYVVPVLLILLSVLDYIKAIASDSEDEIKKVTSKFVKRLIVSVIIFIVPLILEFILGIFGINTNNFCL